MDKCETTFCKFCLTIISDGDFSKIEETLKEVLEVLLLKLSAAENHDNLVMCNECSMKLFAAFNFKATCMDTEDSIFPYVDSENVVPVDLIEVYLKIRDKEHLRSMLDDERICRLCMQFITCGFTPVEEIKIDVFCRYIPEVNFRSTKLPVICSLCVDKLNTHSSFLKNCLDLQEKMTSIDEDCATESTFYIKNEEIKLKTEEYNEYGDIFLHGNELVGKIMNIDSPSVDGLKQENFSNMQMYKYDTCDYRTKLKADLTQHQLKHKDFSETQIKKCCTNKIKFESSLKTHQLGHTDISEVQAYKCDVCDFRTKCKSSLTTHQLKHKVISEEQVYKCDTCDHITKRKSNLIVHQLKHKHLSEVQIYKCDTCDYITKRKDNLIVHQLKHKDFSEVQVYKCDTCDYRTKVKRYLTKHKLRHKDILEVQMYECDACNYWTKYKSSLTKHQLKHKDFSEMQVYKCDM